jgi:DNA-binding CsgD family transcriptional regulator
MAKELTPRQQEVKALTEKGKKAPAIAKQLGITENAVYQHLRAIRGGAKKSSSSSRPKRRSRAATSRRQSGRTSPRAVRTPAAPATAEELLRSEIEQHEATVGAAIEQIAQLNDQIAAANATIQSEQAEAARKGDVLDVLTGKKVAQAKPKPRPARKRASGGKKATGQSGSKGGGKPASGSQASSQASPNGGSAAAPEPKTQAEREASADHDGGAAQAPDPAPATA